MQLIFLIFLSLVCTIGIPFVFLWVVWRLVREFEREIKKRQNDDELDDWHSEKLSEPRECEECNEVIYHLGGGKNKTYVNWQKGARQTGSSKKYPNEIAGYCERHK